MKAFGSKEGSARTPLQTETALFISSIAPGPFQAALRDLAVRREMDISDRARLFAAVNMSVADAAITCWDCKVHYGFWRPITAIQLADEDGNPATTADPAWEPLIPNPPYPDYTSGLNAVIGSATRALTRVLGTDRIDLTITLAGDEHHPALRVRGPPVRRRGRRPRLGGHPFPLRGRGRDGAGPAGRRLGARPLLQARVGHGEGLARVLRAGPSRAQRRPRV